MYTFIWSKPPGKRSHTPPVNGFSAKKNHRLEKCGLGKGYVSFPDFRSNYHPFENYHVWNIRILAIPFLWLSFSNISFVISGCNFTTTQNGSSDPLLPHFPTFPPPSPGGWEECKVIDSRICPGIFWEAERGKDLVSGILESNMKYSSGKYPTKKICYCTVNLFLHIASIDGHIYLKFWSCLFIDCIWGLRIIYVWVLGERGKKETSTIQRGWDLYLRVSQASRFKLLVKLKEC